MNKIASRAVRAGLVVLAAMSATACATITRGTKEAWTVQTDPGNAPVRTSAGYSCEATPCTFRLPRKTEFQVTISKPGYRTFQGYVTNQVATAGAVGMAGNVLVGGVIGAGVDLTTGAMLEFQPNPLVVRLEPDPAAVAARSVIIE